MKRQVKIAPFVVLLGLFLTPLSPLFAASDWDAYKASGQRSPTWDALVEAGFKAFDTGNIGTAVQFLERARTLGCKDGLVLFKLANDQEMQNRPQQAVQFLMAATPSLESNYPKNQATLELPEHLGGLYYQMGQYDLALPQFQQAIQNEGEDFFRLSVIGQIYRMKKDTENAQIYFEQALKYDPPQNAPALKIATEMELLKIYYDAKEDDKALAMANLILTQDPQNRVVLSYRDNLAKKQSKKKQQEVMQKIIDKN